MFELSVQEVEQVWQRLEEEGIEMPELRQNLLDHVCCSIEAGVSDGLSFKEAFEKAFANFGSQGLRHIQLETTFLLQNNDSPMRQTSFISGIVAGALVAGGSYFKIQHWAGANEMTLLGIAGLLFVFLPSIFFPQIKNEEKLAGKMSQISGWLSISIVLTGAILRFLHQPGGTSTMNLGVLMAILIYFPLMLFKNSQNPQTSYKNKFVVVAFMLSIAGFSFMNLKAPSNVYKKGFTSTNANLLLVLNQLTEQEKSLPKSVKNLDRIQNAENSIRYLDSVKTRLVMRATDLQYPEAEKTSLEEIDEALGMTAVQEMLISEGKATEIYHRLQKIMDLKMDAKPFSKQNFEAKSWIVAYTNLTSLQIRVQVEKLKIYQEK